MNERQRNTYSSQYRNVNACNSVNKDTVEVGSVHKMKEKLDKYRMGRRTI